MAFKNWGCMNNSFIKNGIIKDQIKKNYLYNIFNENVNLYIGNIEKFYFDTITEDQIDALSKYSVDILSSYLYKDNQYIYFDTESLKDLNRIYQSFYISLSNQLDRYTAIKDHHVNIKNFLVRTNPFLKIINSNNEIMVKTFLCSEYSGDFQLKLFKIKKQDIIEPVLDLGCGEHANLVNFLNNQGINAIGIDRKIDGQPHTVECDWFDYNFEEKKYGVVFSNNAFSIHFISALNKNQNIPAYTRLFFRILNSLKVGGLFCYAPSIPYIEKYVNVEDYTISNMKINDNLYMTKILRNKQQ